MLPDEQPHTARGAVGLLVFSKLSQLCPMMVATAASTNWGIDDDDTENSGGAYGVGGHVGAEIPDADGVVGAAGDEGARREDGLRLAAVRHRRRVHLQAPDARRVEDERVGLADLKLGRGADDTFSTL